MPRLLSACDRYGGLAFAGFVLLHFGWQAFRARTDGALPATGVEARPEVVIAFLLVVWLPFAVFAWRKLRPSSPTREVNAPGEKARALAIVERVALVAVLSFTAFHAAQIVLPLLNGVFAPSDVRPELVALLSSTQYGVPLTAAAYSCGVGAAAFFGSRQALAAFGGPGRRARARVVVALGVAGYLLGIYAVIRGAGGTLLP